MQAILGIAVLLALAWLLSERRSAVPWRVVGAGLALQFAIALLLVHVTPIREAILALNVVVEALDDASRAGASFVFGYLAGGNPPFEITDASATYLLGFRLVPQILLFSVIAALGWYWRVLPAAVRLVGALLRRVLGVGGAVGLGAAVSIFVGMVEAPLTIRPLLGRLDRGELFVVLSCGMATVAGTVMVLYASILSPVLPGALGHILAASVISAPAAILVASTMIPAAGRTEGAGGEPGRRYDSAMDAISRGTQDGIRLAAGVIAMLIVIVSLVALVNGLLGALPAPGEQPLTLQRLLGWGFAPLAWLIGIPWSEAVTAGSLLGTKLVLNELIAYLDLAATAPEALSAHSRLILTYAMCGFANLGSLGIMIGGVVALCPERRHEILQLAPRTLISGTLATLMTGAVIGLVQPV